LAALPYKSTRRAKMKKYAAVLAVIAGLVSASANAESDATSYKALKKQAATRYAEDRKLCADESTAEVRMQCLRDAKAEYKKALAAAKESSTSHQASSCDGCGRVVSVTAGEKEGEGTPLGLIAGGVAGALLGHQVGEGTGKDIATIAGAAGGAYAGRKIEQKVKSKKLWTVAVKFDNGDEKSFSFDHDPGFAQGDLVRTSGDSIVRR
jgi:outer membrane lipoprotein SlyB